MEYKFENVQCLKKANLVVEKDAINLKYGYNGLGKSSIIKGLKYYYEKSELRDDLKDELIPYHDKSLEPKVTVDKDEFDSVFVFDSFFIESFCAKGQDNVMPSDVSNRYYLSTPDIEKLIEDIKSFLNKIELASSDSIVEQFLKTVEETKKIKINDAGSIMKQSAAGKGLADNGPLSYITDPDIKETYDEILHSKTINDWLEWRNSLISNKKNLFDFGTCPMCGNKISEELKLINENLNNLLISNPNLKNLKSAKDAINALKAISSSLDADKLDECIPKDSAINDEQITFLSSHLEKASLEGDKINNLRCISERVFSDNEMIEQLSNDLINWKLDKTYFECFPNSDKFDSTLLLNKINEINDAIDSAIEAYSDLAKKMEELNSKINDAITLSKDTVNRFLKRSGIPYEFLAEAKKGESDFKTYLHPLRDKDPNSIVASPGNHLSYGENNSLALAIFGALAAKRDDKTLIVLDDPVSSFDENKKFALLSFLFDEENGLLNDKTVVVITHDIEPLVDITKCELFKSMKTTCSYFKKTINGDDEEVEEVPVEREDIISAVDNATNFQKDPTVDIFSRIAFYRIGMEIQQGFHVYNKEGYKLASSFLKAYSKPSYSKDSVMDSKTVAKGNEFIGKFLNIPNFDYCEEMDKNGSFKSLFSFYKNSKIDFQKVFLCRVIIEKTKRIIGESATLDQDLFRFITNAFHVENMSLYMIKGYLNISPRIKLLLDEVVEKVEQEVINQNLLDE